MYQIWAKLDHICDEKKGAVSSRVLLRAPKTNLASIKTIFVLFYPIRTLNVYTLFNFLPSCEKVM